MISEYQNLYSCSAHWHTDITPNNPQQNKLNKLQCDLLAKNDIWTMIFLVDLARGKSVIYSTVQKVPLWTQHYNYVPW
jgi:hypothetical protein